MVLSHGTVLFIKNVVSTVEGKKSVDACDNSDENSLATSSPGLFP